MKKYLALLLALAMLFALAVPAMAADEGSEEEVIVPFEIKEDLTGTVVILHSNDVHGAIEGYAKMATLKAMYEKAGAKVIVVDAGDFSQGEPAVSVSKGATAVELMSLAGYDLATAGNHEFDYGYENLKTILEKATFKLINANIVEEESEAAVFDPTYVVEAGGIKIGFLGLETPETATKAHPAKIKGLKFVGGHDMYDLANTQVEALQAENCDVIVCLGHLGIDEESELNGNTSLDLLTWVSDIDVFIDGHSHSTTADIAAKINNAEGTNVSHGALVASTGTKFANIGVITIKNGEITTELVDTKRITVAEDNAVLVRAKAIEAEIEADYGATFATSEVELNGAKAPGNRNMETNNGDLITDAMLWLATKDDLGVPAENVVALTNGGGIRAAIAVGDVSKKAVNTVLPFGNTVAVDYVTGAVLLEALEASTFCTPDAVGGFPQVAGIKFTLNVGMKFDAGENYPGTTYAKPNSINRVTIDSINGKAFDPEATYAVVTNDFVAAGGDTYYALSVSETITDTGVPLDEAVMQYITDVLGGKITAEKYGEPQGRIAIVNRPADLVENAWWYDAAIYCLDAKTMNGTDKGFDPVAEVTTATVYQVLYNRDGAKVETESEDWWAAAMTWAAEEGLYDGDVTTFTDGVIDRQGIFDILEAYCTLHARTTKGLMVGNENGDMMWEKSLTRAEFATILMRLDTVR